MSVTFYATEMDGPIDSNIKGRPHNLDILEQDGQIIISIAPFGDHSNVLKLHPPQDQLKTLALALLAASQRVCAVEYEDIPRPIRN